MVHLPAAETDTAPRHWHIATSSNAPEPSARIYRATLGAIQFHTSRHWHFLSIVLRIARLFANDSQLRL